MKYSMFVVMILFHDVGVVQKCAMQVKEGSVENRENTKCLRAVEKMLPGKVVRVAKFEVKFAS